MFSQIRNISIACIILVALGGVFQTATADTEANKAISRRDFEEAMNQRKLEVYDEIVAPEVVLHTSSGGFTGIDGFKAVASMYLNAFPDFHITIEDMFAEGDLVCIRFTNTGTHQGELMGIPATGASIVGTGIAIHRIADGRIQEAWLFADDLGVMQQLGVMPPMPEGPPAMQRAAPEDFVWSAPSDVTGDPGTPETNKAIVQREFDAWNQGDIDALLTVLDEIYASNFVYNDPARPHVTDLASYKQWAAEECFAPFPDLDMPIEDIIAEGDKVVVRWTFTGTHIGLGREVTQTGISIYRIADGKVVEIWCACDMLGTIQQLTTPEWPIAGAWISIIPIPGLGDIIGEWTVSPQDLGGTNFTSMMRPAKPEATVFGSFPDADHQSDHIGQTVKTGLNTYESTMVGYGTKKAELPGMLPEIVYISVIYSKVQLIDENTIAGQGTHAFYLASADADGDGLPDEGQEPIACLPYMITAKRVGVMPPCVPPPPPPEEE
jgi:steroid delta-isomerase-like uncharacterized protein